MTDSLAERDRQRNVNRAWAQMLPTQRLAELLFAMAEQPNRFKPVLRYAVLYTAGARLRALEEAVAGAQTALAAFDQAQPQVPDGATEVWPHLFVYSSELGAEPDAERVFWMFCDRCQTLQGHDSYIAAHRTAMEHHCPKAGQRSLELDD